MSIIANINIIPVNTHSVDSLRQLSMQTFFETYAAKNTASNMEQYAMQTFSRERLLAEIKNLLVAFYFAYQREELVGYIKINVGTAQTDIQTNDCLEIERIYILKSFQGKNIGQLLLHKAFEIARMKNFSFVWLGVWEENPRAIHFYEKNGFTSFGKHSFKLGEDIQSDILMKYVL